MLFFVGPNGSDFSVSQGDENEYQSNYTIIVEYDDGFALALDQEKSELLCTPKGSVVTHSNEEFIRHIKSELEQFPILKTENGALIGDQIGHETSYSQYSGLLDFSEEMKTPDLEDVEYYLAKDPLLHATPGPGREDQYKAWEPLVEYFVSIGIQEGLRIFKSGLNNEMCEFFAHLGGQDDCDEDDNNFISFSEFSSAIESDWNSLTKPQRIVINVLVTRFDSLLAALCWVKGSCSSSEYAHAVLAGSPYFHVFGTYIEGIGHTIDDVSSGQDHRDSYKEAVEVVNICNDFLRFVDSSRIELEKLIEKGEGKNIEFKSTLRWNIKAKRNDDAITHASIKTIAAFLNTEGGKLFIGLDDEGKALGLMLDSFQNDDKFMLHLMNVVKQQLGQNAASYVDPTIHIIKGQHLCQIECKRSPETIFLKYKKNPDGEFFIRTGPGTTKLTPEEMMKYIRTHFNN